MYRQAPWLYSTSQFQTPDPSILARPDFLQEEERVELERREEEEEEEEEERVKRLKKRAEEMVSFGRDPTEEVSRQLQYLMMENQQLKEDLNKASMTEAEAVLHRQQLRLLMDENVKLKGTVNGLTTQVERQEQEVSCFCHPQWNP